MESVSDTNSTDSNSLKNCLECLFTITNSTLTEKELRILSDEIYDVIMASMCWFMIPFLLFLGIPGNVLSAIVFYRQGLRERINVCLFILALTDLVSVAILFLLYVEDRVRKHLDPNTWFIFVYLGTVKSAERASQFLSAVISCERCFCVVSPLHAKRLLKTSTMTAIVVVCCVVLIGGMCVIVIPKHTVGFMYDPSANITKSFFTVTKYYIDNKEIVDIFDIIIYATALPITYFFVIAICTSITAMKLHAAVKQRKSMTNATTGTEKTLNRDTSMSSKEVAVTRMLIGTSVLFLVCMIPNIGLQIFTLLIRELNFASVYSTLNLSLWYFVYMCRGVRSSVNFCVYYIMGSKFRELVHSFCRCVGQTSNNKVFNNGVRKILVNVYISPSVVNDI